MKAPEPPPYGRPSRVSPATHDVHTSLHDLQAWMQQTLIRPETAAEIQQYIAAPPTLSAQQALAIYQHGYYARLVQCMEGQFKALCHTLGKDLFGDFCREYLRQFPSQSPTLSHLGERFPDFLSAHRPDAGTTEKEPWIDFMIELAHFERDLFRVFDAPGYEGRPYADEMVAGDSIRLQPCIFLHTYGFLLGAYYHAVAQGDDPEIPEARTDYVAFCRKDFRIGIFTLSAAQYAFLEELKKGDSVEHALRETSRTFDTPLPDVRSAWEAWKKAWLGAGFFAG